MGEKNGVLLKIEKYNEAVLSTKAIKRLSNLLPVGHIPYIPKPLEKDRIPITAHQTGLCCHKCHEFSKGRQSRKRICRT